MTHHWLILTGEYPPERGGVSDYSRQVAEGLARRGDRVVVWTQEPLGARGESAEVLTPRDAAAGGELHVRRLHAAFGQSGLERARRVLHAMPPDARLLVQYVPHAFGYRAMNVGLCTWLAARGRERAVDVMFHEVAYPVAPSQPLKHNLLGCVNRSMAYVLARSAARALVSTPSWEPMLRGGVRRGVPVTWLPVPSNVPSASRDDGRVAHRRADLLERLRARGDSDTLLIGHFGSYGPLITPLLADVLPAVLRQDRAGGHGRAALVLVGRGGEAFASELSSRFPDLRGRWLATGELGAREVAEHLSACDLLYQPYLDGASARRGSMIAGLAQGKAVVSNRGHACDVDRWTDPLSIATAPSCSPADLIETLERVLRDRSLREDLGERARRVYDAQFDLRHTLAALRAGASAGRDG